MAKRVVTVSVTQEDIDYGEAGHYEKCTVALALYRATGEVWHVSGLQAHRASHNSPNITLPSTASDFVTAFDNGELVKPFSFSMEV